MQVLRPLDKKTNKKTYPSHPKNPSKILRKRKYAPRKPEYKQTFLNPR
ncbi:hypothetical protein ACJROX_01180 [Pseudalkalibacillus sp. A8]